jgi:hypothetical protein
VVEGGEHFSIATLDPGAVRGIDPAVVGGAAEALDGGFGGLGVDVDCWGEVARVAFEVEQGAGEVEGYFDGADLGPAVCAAVGVDDGGDEVGGAGGG